MTIYPRGDSSLPALIWRESFGCFRAGRGWLTVDRGGAIPLRARGEKALTGVAASLAEALRRFDIGERFEVALYFNNGKLTLYGHGDCIGIQNPGGTIHLPAAGIFFDLQSWLAHATGTFDYTATSLGQLEIGCTRSGAGIELTLSEAGEPPVVIRSDKPAELADFLLFLAATDSSEKYIFQLRATNSDNLSLTPISGSFFDVDSCDDGVISSLNIGRSSLVKIASLIQVVLNAEGQL